MDVDQYIYANGEVFRLWLFPQDGGDGGFRVYPGQGTRHADFDTTPVAHALGEPCYVVEPHPPGSTLIPNGLPVFPVYYENDDDSLRRFGSDSRLTFTAPADGTYLVRVTDARGFQGADFKYQLTVRPPRPDFRVSVQGRNPVVGAGSGQEFQMTAERLDGFDGEIRVDITGLPPGFSVTTPLVIQAGQTAAYGTINALPSALTLTPENAGATKVTASAVVNGKPVTKTIDNVGEIKLADKPKVLVAILPPDEPPKPADRESDDALALPAPLELTIAPGKTITARVRIERNGFTGPVQLLGGLDVQSNLPHGVVVDNLGLNGLLIPEGETERTFFLRAASWVPETTRPFHLKAKVPGNPTSWPVVLHVRRPRQPRSAPKGDQPAPAEPGSRKEKPSPRLRVSDVTIHEDMDCFKVETPNATYVYGKKGAGFASILDKDGRDWISYRPGDKARGEFRGLPKCGQPTKFFHCGYGYGQYKTDNVFESKVTVQDVDHVQISSETVDKKSACTWDFYPTHATLTLLRIDLPTFWFLYEGTPGGRLDADKDFVIRPDGRKTTLDEPWSQVVPWGCFGAGETPVGFVCVNHQEPEKGQTDSYVSWPFEKDKDGSFQDMTVFGFCRKDYKELVKHVPDLTRLPARYSIGFVDKADHATANAMYEKFRRMPKVGLDEDVKNRRASGILAFQLHSGPAMQICVKNLSIRDLK